MRVRDEQPAMAMAALLELWTNWPQTYHVYAGVEILHASVLMSWFKMYAVGGTLNASGFFEVLLTEAREDSSALGDSESVALAYTLLWWGFSNPADALAHTSELRRVWSDADAEDQLRLSASNRDERARHLLRCSELERDAHELSKAMNNAAIVWWGDRWPEEVHASAGFDLATPE